MTAFTPSPIRTLAAVCGVAVLGLGTTACGGPQMSPMMMSQASAAHHFSMAVHMGEVEEGQLALSRSQNAQVRAFAQQMVSEHTMGMQMEEQMMMSMHMGPGDRLPPDASMTGGNGTPVTVTSNGASSGSMSGGTVEGSAASGMPMSSAEMQRMRADLMNNPASRPVVEDHMRGMQMLQGLNGAQFDHAYMTRQVTLHRYALEQMDRMMAAMGESAGSMSMSGGSMNGGSMGSGSSMNMSGVVMGTREGMMMMHQHYRAMVAMHLEQAQQIVASMR